MRTAKTKEKPFKFKNKASRKLEILTATKNSWIELKVSRFYQGENMSRMLSALKTQSNRTLTENNADTLSSSGSYVLDLFAMGGAVRNREVAQQISLFSKALAEDRNLALKCLFYLRDIRGGQGERTFFRTNLAFLAQNYPEILAPLLEFVPEFGRWDDTISILKENVHGDIKQLIFNIVRDQLILDLDAKENVSLLAKWMPSINTSSAQTKQLAKLILKGAFCEWTPKIYRKNLASLRKKIDVLERKMCSKEWNKIDYSHVPSKASLQYRTAFYRNDEDRYKEYISSVEKGEAKINTGTLYPYEIVEKIIDRFEVDKTLEVLWNNLPNYCGDKPSNAIVVADTSGSMSGRPLATSVSLAMYFAERSNGPYKNHFITFSSKPKLQEILGNTLHEKVMNLRQAEWQQNTDLQAVFDLILRVAKKDNISQEEMIDTLYIISDMEFDSAVSGRTNFEVIQDKYNAAGYKMPTLVFWNVNSHQQNVAASASDANVVLISGSSPSVFKNAMTLTGKTPYDFMVEVLNSDRYKNIHI